MDGQCSLSVVYACCLRTAGERGQAINTYWDLSEPVTSEHGALRHVDHLEPAARASPRNLDIGDSQSGLAERYDSSRVFVKSGGEAVRVRLDPAPATTPRPHDNQQ